MLQPYEGKKRLFLALWPDDLIRKQLANFIPSTHGRGVNPQTLHITLVFLGNTSFQDLRQLMKSIDEIKASTFSFQLNTYGWWKRAGIFWIGMQEIPGALSSLAETLAHLARQLGFKLDERPYSPHVTLARKVKQRIQLKQKVLINWSVDHFVLVESVPVEGGVEYRVLYTWIL